MTRRVNYIIDEDSVCDPGLFLRKTEQAERRINGDEGGKKTARKKSKRIAAGRKCFARGGGEAKHGR